MVGIPKGLFSSFPGLGIHTLLTGETLEPKLILSTSLKRCFGVRFLTPSIPAVFEPWLSWVTLRTEINFALLDLISSFWSRLTFLISPRLDA